MKKICFTGYRPLKLPFKISKSDEQFVKFYDTAKKLILAEIELGNSYFISGMAQGVDIVMAEIVLEFKKIYPFVFLECALPFKEQSDNWTLSIKNIYCKILQESDKKTVISDKKTSASFLLRNKYMVDKSDIVIAVFDGQKGGTKFTCDYATKKGKELIILNPKSLQMNIQYKIKIV